MAEITIVQDKVKQKIQADKGTSLLRALIDAGVTIDSPCGGKGSCKKCLVKIDGKECLACREIIDEDMEVEIADTGLFNRILTGVKIREVKKNPMYTGWGAAIDIGTTTVCASLIGEGGVIAEATRKNPQSVFGGDVISRIEKALRGNLPKLTESIRDLLRAMLSELCDKANIGADEIDGVVITGNTAMLYFLTEQSPESISQAPFKADRLFGEYVSAASLNLGISENAKVYLPPCLSAFLGADMVTAILASGMQEEDNAFIADIGTNGELGLWHRGRLYCASAAAGPAFEGAGISCGVYGIRGAIDKAWVDKGKISVRTIEGEPAIGICGSGIIDMLSAMLELGIIDKTGAFKNDSFLEIQKGITVTLQDVRQIQLAKAAICGGIETLITAAGTEKSQISALYLAGGFGNYLDLNNAAAIGLIPPELLPVAKCIGNAAHAGAAMILQDCSLIKSIDGFLKNARVESLEVSPVFTDNYIRCMMF